MLGAVKSECVPVFLIGATETVVHSKVQTTRKVRKMEIMAIVTSFKTYMIC